MKDAGHESAVMKQIELRLPLVLGLNAKVVCSPEGLTFRPKVSGSITQSQLKAKLQAKLAADPTADIDVNRALATSDLSVSDLTAEIAIELPKVWNERFKSKATFKRVNKATTDGSEEEENTNSSNDTNAGEGGGGENTNPSNGSNGGGENTNPTNPTNGGGGNSGGGGTDPDPDDPNSGD